MPWVESSFESKISPIVLFVTVLLAVVLFVAALVHLLLRFLYRQRSANSRNYPAVSTSGAAFQRQLQQLFHLQDSGLDQAHIESLPVFLYEDVITGSKEPFDCAVCLCEFTEQDRLRLLPSCSHAFHVACIDTWLLSNSSCPLCRGVISSSGFSFENPFSYSEDSSKESNENGGISGNSGFVIGDDDGLDSAINGRRVFSVRLGKFRHINSNSNNNNNNNCGENQESEVGESSNFHAGGELDARRCFSMGSFQYVVADLDLQVALYPSFRGGGGGPNGNFTFDGVNGGGEVEGKKIYSGDKGESFSVSKIWQWSKKDKVFGLP